MLYDPQAFLHSLCAWAAARATGTLVAGVQTAGAIAPPCPTSYATAFGSAPWNLFLNAADEGSAPDPAAAPYAVIRIYGGHHERSNPKPTIAVQLKVTAQSRVKGFFLANSLYRCFCLTNQERELRSVLIPGIKLADNSADGAWMLVSAKTTGMPGQVAADDRGRVEIVSNFDLSYYRTSY